MQSANIPCEINAMLLGGIATSDVGVALFDPIDTYVFGSAAFVEFLDVQPGPQSYASMMRHCHRVGRGIAILDPDIEGWLERALAKRRSQPVRHYEKDLRDGRWLRISETTFGEGWVLNILSDISDLKLHEATLRQARDAAVTAAETDCLTGLPNRAFSESRFIDAFTYARKADEAFSISLIDLDHFKRINDGYGHAVGDQVLVDFARVGRAALGATDILGRVGGEEFIVIMPRKNAIDARQAIERLRIAVERSRPLSIHDFRYTMSAGIATMSPLDTPQELHRRADKVLYRSKRSGRNQVTIDPLLQPIESIFA